MPARSPSPESPAPHDRWTVVGAAVLLVAHLGFRAWAVYPGFFYSDDYQLVREAGREPLSVEVLLSPHHAQFMPFGRFVAWVGSLPDHMSWPLLATTSLLMQAAAAVACLWMLVSLFGWRRRVLALLALYLSCAITMPAFMWWAAALNQVPLQAVFFASVATWVHYLRSRRLRWLALTLVILGFGLCCYVKALLVFPTLAFLAVAYFAEGGPVTRTVQVVRRYWPAVLVGVAGGLAYLGYYVATVPQLASDERPTGAADLVEVMVGRSFVTALLGGPWRWDEVIAPAGQADPPRLLVYLCWIVVALVVAYVALRRERTLRAWGFLAAYVGADYLLLLTTRAQVVGAISGTEYRYLTDAMCAVVLAVGLATMELRGAPATSRERQEPLLARGVSTRFVAAGTALVVASGLWSSATYARIWHTDHPGKGFFTTALADLRADQRVDLANQFLPPRLSGAFVPPYTRSDVLLPLLTPDAAFPAVTHRLHVLADDGTVVPADVDPRTTTGRGPTESCGWQVTGTKVRTLPLRGTAIDTNWWLRIDYLASGDTGLTIEAGDTTRVANLHRGLHELYVAVSDGFDEIRLGGPDPGVTVCVDQVVVGTPEAEETGEAG